MDQCHSKHIRSCNHKRHELDVKNIQGQACAAECFASKGVTQCSNMGLRLGIACHTLWIIAMNLVSILIPYYIRLHHKLKPHVFYYVSAPPEHCESNKLAHCISPISKQHRLSYYVYLLNAVALCPLSLSHKHFIPMSSKAYLVESMKPPLHSHSHSLPSIASPSGRTTSVFSSSALSQWKADLPEMHRNVCELFCPRLKLSQQVRPEDTLMTVLGLKCGYAACRSVDPDSSCLSGFFRLLSGLVIRELALTAGLSRYLAFCATWLAEQIYSGIHTMYAY